MCLALFTLALAAGNRGFLAIGDWITSYRKQLFDLLKPPKNRLPSYSTIRRALLHISYEQYSACLAKLFDVQPKCGEIIGLDGKVLKGSYQLKYDNTNSDSHPDVRDVTQKEDISRIRTTPLPQIFAIARNFTLNLYRNQMFENMAQAQRLCSFGLDTLKRLFRMK